MTHVPLRLDPLRCILPSFWSPAIFLESIHESLHRGKGNAQHLSNVFLRRFGVSLQDVQNCFLIGVIGFNFGIIGVIGVTLFGINDTILISSRVFPIQVDAEIAAHINQFRLTKAIFFCFSKHFWNAAAPSLHDVHVGKGGCDDLLHDFVLLLIISLPERRISFRRWRFGFFRN